MVYRHAGVGSRVCRAQDLGPPRADRRYVGFVGSVMHSAMCPKP